ncbi:SNF2-related domain-containing protein [Cavenderia fasciculata]|uniref:SNF2-related domain-containing protein n=1 Tax=Cavenderia fasciculata TaxID=261658 RepID=F4PXB9_CACFS|nr:SNF2-related domain-containing protein [Cavenderia fasciculata]EGG19429.1 SNF2-related domain-containing protein [Cavenderia fasciculata]|eukprot:XP_004357723.1 SNF2-related domain-containing protein [Cavenderia fasciculata]
MKKGFKGFVTPYKTDTASTAAPPPPITKPSKLFKANTTSTTSTAPPSLTKPSKSSKPLPTKTTTTTQSKDEDQYYKVMWCEASSKKHKTHLDGTLSYDVTKKQAILYDETGKDIGRSNFTIVPTLSIGYKSKISGKEYEIIESIKQSEFKEIKSSSSSTSTSSSFTKSKEKKRKKDQQEEEEEENISSLSHNDSFKNVLPNSTLLKTRTKILSPLFNPNATNAFVLHTPTIEEIKNNTATHVVVDPHLSSKLRPHQRLGVEFLYQCLTGNKHEYGYGAILADQMGLGKTLQALTLIWTMVQQNPNSSTKPMVKKVIIVAPATLIGNWRSEIITWLGREKLKPVTLSDKLKVSKADQLKDFGESQTDPVLIISYEQCVSYSNQLEKLSDIGLLIADEGHRIKNATTKTAMAVNSIKATRRIILSGTPIQNDLYEFYAMVDFVNPGALGTPNEFRRDFATPIQKSRDSNSNQREKDQGILKSIQLAKMTSSFILRRKSNVLEKYLPLKSTQIIFCKMPSTQSKIYQETINSFAEKDFSLSNIILLKKLCNSKDSGKLLFVGDLIKSLPRGEKIVLVSNYTQTLDIFETLCKELSFGFLRLDGQVEADSRQFLITKFNDPADQHKVFLLSAKAGGVGINLIGANHIVLFDPDWNPAVDLQAMERVWRQGQEKNYFDKGGFTTDELKDIFSFNSNTSCETHDLLQCKCSCPSNSLGGGGGGGGSKLASYKNDVIKGIDHHQTWFHLNQNYIQQIKNQSINISPILLSDLFTKHINYIFIKRPQSINQDIDIGESLSFLEETEQIEEEKQEMEEDDEEEEYIEPTKTKRLKKQKI